jgi:hypothetical protein
MFAVGTTSVTCSATDAAGNTSSTSFDVVVTDTTPPVLHAPGGVVWEATGPGGAPVTFTASAVDLVDGSVPASCSPSSGSTFALGSSHVMCSAIDAHGNVAHAGFDVIVRDTTAPVLTITGNAHTYDVDQTVALSCAAVDLVSSATCSPSAVTAPAWSYGAGAETLSFAATDAAGNTGRTTATFDVTPTVNGMVNLTTALVTKPQLAGALVAKLQANSFDAYRQQLTVQSGKGIAPADVALLVDLSYALSTPKHSSTAKV